MFPPESATGNFKIGKPYQVDGKWYFPEESYELTETGIASWYGPGFHGKRTANGEIFDEDELTAAHRTLQMPSLVRVTNLENGRSLIVRVNDRGPFKRSRVIDVSSRAAELLGFKGNGTAKVKLQVLRHESLELAEAARRGMDTRGTEVVLNQPVAYHPAQPATGSVRGGRFLPEPTAMRQAPVVPTGIYVQAGSFADSANAYHHAQSLAQFGRTSVFPAVVHGQQFYRVRIGPIGDVTAADRLLGQIMADGRSQAIIIVD
ncbi:MAG: septal ring lytic transglycosylase RlpA family protein [Alphaproteobacteria bacterium]|nr:septal ring lytic transglycosylase RlpA family protein [Alphaproteobacteria bacterium]